jgi:putative Holliday junction resolvase
MDRAPGRALGLDLGARRIGVALSDSLRTIASPYAVLERSGDLARDRATIAALIEEVRATVCVVGLPLALDGRIGVAARGALDEAAALGELLDVPVVTADERMTTVEVERRRLEHAALADAGRRGGRGARRSSAYGAARSRARPIVDDAAAAVMLQAWIEADTDRDER